ncbi:MAG: hypothetical protein QOF70_3016, partial [Acetobacteraceae bacterium]|nr:hypothetical protein [Acetobacteraceae bacterium]
MTGRAGNGPTPVSNWLAVLFSAAMRNEAALRSAG